MKYALRASPLAIAIAMGAVSTQPARAADNADDIIVTGAKPALDAGSGTKSSKALIETPQSISVITRAELEMRGVNSLNEALRLTAGITPETRGSNAEVYDQFKLRGFDAARYLDGLKLFDSPTGYASPQIDISRLERIEVVKGPASVLYGQSSPGGLIAMESKRPDGAAFHGGIDASVGTYSLYRVDADVGGAIDADGHVLYRLYGTINGADTQQSFGKRRRYSISPSVTFGAGTDTTLTLIGNYSHDPYNGNYGGVPRLGSLDPNPNGRVPRDFADGDPGVTVTHRNQGSITWLAEHKLGGSWAIRSNGRYTDITNRIAGVYGTSMAPDGINLMRGSYRTREHLKNWTLDQQVAGTVKTGALTHDLLIGLDFQHARSIEHAGFGTAPDLDVFDPVYGVPITMPDYATTYLVHQRQIGLYGQDQISLGGFRLTASGRYDWARGHVEVPEFGQDDTQKNGKFTYRLGGLYLTDFGLAPYVSYSTSFEPQATRLANGDMADPSTGKQIEAGLKYQPSGMPILLTAAWFHIIQSNIVSSNPITFEAFQSGKVRSQGVELEAKANVGKSVVLTANYSRQQIRVREDENPVNVGHPLIGTAKANGGFFGTYTVQSGALEGFGLGGGMRYVGQGYGGFLTDAQGAVSRYVTTPSYTLFDAVLTYDLGKASARLQGLDLRVNASNLFDKRHVTSCYINGVEWCWYGQRRTVMATLGYHW